METNTKLAIIFALATGLMSGAALAMDAGASLDSSAVDIQKVRMLYDDGANPLDDKILWGGAAAIRDFISDNEGLFPAVDAVLDVPPSPAHPTDPLVFLSDRAEIRRDFAYQPSFDRAALAAEEPQDRGLKLIDLYTDNARMIAVMRENPGVIRDDEVLAVVAAAFSAPGRDSIDPEGRVTTPTDETLAELAAVVPPEEEPAPTINSTYILVAARSGLLNNEQYRLLSKIFREILKYEAAGLVYPLPEGITDALIKVKDQVGGILASCNHDTFHLSDAATGKAAAGSSPCHLDPT
jgi:hypothetical protein